MSNNANNNGSKLKKKLGLRLRFLRKSISLTQEELSFRSNLDRSYIASIEQGRRNVSLVNLHKIAVVFSMTLSEFLEGVNGNHNNRK
ncbi:MAG: helix-turn-helix transcriptional regulator [Bacteroidota bacterium]